MSEFVYPNSILDKPAELLSTLGELWSHTYDGLDLLLTLCAARSSLDKQAYDDLTELVASVSRLTVPVLSTDRWYCLTLKESLRNTAVIQKFGNALQPFGAGGERFGVPNAAPFSAWVLPEGLAHIPAVMNRITSPSVTFVDGVDYSTDNGAIIFRDNPFDNDLVPKRGVLADGVQVDREIELWVFRGLFDRQQVYRQFGYILKLKLDSGDAYKSLVNALFDCLVDGTTARRLREAWAAIAGVPLVEGDETVQVIAQESDRLLVITDKKTYAFSPLATPIVAIGAVVAAGDALTDAITFYEFNRGQVPAFEDLRALALGRGMLASGYFGDLVFQNKDVPVVVTFDDDGYTRIDFEVDGWPGDVVKFFDDLHANGRAVGQTLAHLLDRRPTANRDTEPTAAVLPTTINPLKFLCQNVLRDNAFVVKIRASACMGGCGLHNAKALRAVMQPQTVMLVLAELEYTDDPITMDGPGTATRPGYTETAKVYLGLNHSESIDGSTMIGERVRLRQIHGRCT